HLADVLLGRDAQDAAAHRLLTLVPLRPGLVGDRRTGGGRRAGSQRRAERRCHETCYERTPIRMVAHGSSRCDASCLVVEYRRYLNCCLTPTHLAIGVDVRELQGQTSLAMVSLAFRGNRPKEGEMVSNPIGGGGRAGSKAAEGRALGHHQPRCWI